MAVPVPLDAMPLPNFSAAADTVPGSRAIGRTTLAC